MKQTNREATDFPIVCLDIEKDEQFEEITKVILLNLYSEIEMLGYLWIN